MGIDIELEAKLPAGGIFSRLKNKINWEAALLASLKETMGEYGLSDFIPEIDYVANGRLPLNYCEEWGDVSSKEGRLVVATRTSTCGPGYHAAFCAGIDDFARKFKLTFSQTDSTGDETGYFASRDYKSLQNYFANFLKQLATHITKDPNDTSQLRLQLPLQQLTPDGKGGDIFTPRGLMSYPDFKRIADAVDSDSLSSAKNWFPWWDESPSADDYLKLASQVMWTDIPWHVPADGYETHKYKAAISAIQKAKAMGANAAWFNNEYNEMLKLLADLSESYPVPSKTGIGYRRHDCRWNLAPSWTGVLPGYLYTEYTEDTLLVYHGDFSAHLSSYTFKQAHNEIVAPEVSDGATIIVEGVNEKFRWIVERSRSTEDNNFINDQVCARSINGMLLVTFTHNGELNREKLLEFVENLVLTD